MARGSQMSKKTDQKSRVQVEPSDAYLDGIVKRVISNPKDRIVRFKRWKWALAFWRHDGRLYSNVRITFILRMGHVSYRAVRRLKEAINRQHLSFQAFEISHTTRGGGQTAKPISDAVTFAVEWRAFEAAGYRLREMRRAAKRPAFNPPIVAEGRETRQ